MSIIEAYLFLFFDSMLGRMLIPIHSPYVLDAMLEFGNYDKALMWLFGSLGAIMGLSLNFFLGRLLRTIPKEPIIINKLQKPVDLYKSKGYYILLLCFIPIIGELISVFSGLIKLPFKKYLPLTAISIVVELMVIVIFIG